MAMAFSHTAVPWVLGLAGMPCWEFSEYHRYLLHRGRESWSDTQETSLQNPLTLPVVGWGWGGVQAHGPCLKPASQLLLGGPQNRILDVGLASMTFQRWVAPGEPLL